VRIASSSERESGLCLWLIAPERVYFDNAKQENLQIIPIGSFRFHLHLSLI